MTEAARWLVPPPAREAEVVEVDRALIRALGLPEPAPDADGQPWRYLWKPSAAVCAAWRAPVGVRPSQWAERHFIVTEGSRPGPWRNANAPYLAGILDAWAEPYVRDVSVQAGPQLGKSKTAEILVAYIADRDPGLVQYVVPDETSAAELVDERLRPMFEDSPRLSRLLTGNPKDLTAKKFRLKTMRIMMVWAGSTARLAAKAAKYQFRDEVNKYPAAPSKKEAGTEALLDKRQRTFRWDKKVFRCSSPTDEGGAITKAMAVASAIYHYHVQCPLCGHMQRMYLTGPDGRPGLRWPDDERDPARIEDALLAWYQCERCDGHWDDARRDRAVARGEWREETTGLELFAHLRKYRPRRIGFQLAALLSMFVSLSEVAAAFLRSKSDHLALKDFLNGYMGEPWLNYREDRQEKRILALTDDRPRGVLPGGGRVACLLGTVDTQDKDFVYTLRAFGYGMERESWLVREGRAETFEAVEQILWGDEYRDADGLAHAVRLSTIDSGGTRTAEVYDFCLRHAGAIVPFRGERRMTRPYDWTHLEYFPGTKKVIPGGLRLLRADTTLFKNLLAAKLAIHPTDPGAFHLHSEATDDYARQMCAEYFDEEEGAWLCPPKKANHFWDCEVYMLVLTEVLGVKFWKRPEDQPARPAAPVAAVARHGGGRSVPSAIARRRG